MAIVQAYTKAGIDQKLASRSNMTLVHGGGGTPDPMAFPDSKTGDVVERSGDGARWRFIGNTLTPMEGRVVSVQGKSGVVTLDASDIGAAKTTHTHTKAQITDLIIRETVIGGSVVQRDDSGRISTATPVSGAHAATKAYVDARPAIFKGASAPPTSIPGARVGDIWLDTRNMRLYDITGV